MPKFIPTNNFTGFPDGNHRNPMRFKAGVESDEVPAEFLALMKQKGFVAGDKEALQLAPKRPAKQLDAPKKRTARKLANVSKPKRPDSAGDQPSDSADEGDQGL